MTSTPELPVPDTAVEAFARAVNEQFAPTDEDRAWVRTIAGPVVAAWARAVADDHQYEGGVVDVDHLRYLAGAIERDHKGERHD